METKFIDVKYQIICSKMGRQCNCCYLTWNLNVVECHLWLTTKFIDIKYQIICLTKVHMTHSYLFMSHSFQLSLLEPSRQPVQVDQCDHAIIYCNFNIIDMWDLCVHNLYFPLIDWHLICKLSWYQTEVCHADTRCVMLTPHKFWGVQKAQSPLWPSG